MHDREKDILGKVKRDIVLRYPLFGLPSAKYPVVFRTGMTIRIGGKELPVPARTDGKKVEIDPEYVGTADKKDLLFLICHEDAHIFLCHNTRRNGRDPVLYNIAADFVVNGLLRRAGITPVSLVPLDNPQYDAMTLDEIYRLLEQEAQQQQQKSKSQQQNKSSGDGKGEDGEENGEGEGNEETEDQIEQFAKNKYGGEDNMRQWVGDVQDCSPEDKAEVEQEAKAALKQAIQMAKAAGTLPSNLEEQLTATLEDRIPWAKLLHKYVNIVTREEYHPLRPNRKWLANGYYFPSLHAKTMGELVVAIDNSGSISTELPEFLAQVNLLVPLIKPKKTLVLHFDTRIAHVDTFHSGQKIALNRRYAGGGTEFDPVFDYVDEHKIRPVCMLFFTDLYGSTNRASLPYPVLWVIKGKLKDVNSHYHPKFGKVVEMG